MGMTWSVLFCYRPPSRLHVILNEIAGTEHALEKPRRSESDSLLSTVPLEFSSESCHAIWYHLEYSQRQADLSPNSLRHNFRHNFPPKACDHRAMDKYGLFLKSWVIQSRRSYSNCNIALIKSSSKYGKLFGPAERKNILILRQPSL